MESKDRIEEVGKAYDLAQDVDALDAESVVVHEKALVRKIDLYLLPTIWLMYLLSYIDRTKSVILVFSSPKPHYTSQHRQCENRRLTRRSSPKLESIFCCARRLFRLLCDFRGSEQVKEPHPFDIARLKSPV